MTDKSQSELFGSLSRQLLSGGHRVRFQARGGSMWPTIRHGEMLYVEPVEPEKLCKRDIVLFEEGRRFRAHRLVAVDSERNVFLTRGDAVGQIDAPLRVGQILGRVVAKEENSGGKPHVVQLCGVRARARFLAARSRNIVSRVIRHSSFLMGAKLFIQKRILGAVGLFLLVALLLGVGAAGQVALDATTSIGQRVNTTTPTVTLGHTTTAVGTNLVLVVGVSINIAGNTAVTVSGVTYNGKALTQAVAHNDAGNTRRVEMWYLINPATGTNSVIVSFNGLNATQVGAVVGVSTFTGADQTKPIRSSLFADGAAGALAQLNVPSAYTDMVIDTLAIEGDRTVTTFGPSQAAQWQLNSGGVVAATDVFGTGSTRSGAPSVPLSEAFSGNSNWSVAALSLQPLQADLGVSVVGSSAFFPQTLTYTITVTDNGPSIASNVVLTDTLPAGLTYVSATPTQGSCSFSAPTLTCNLINLNATATVSLVVTPGAVGGYADTATVTSSTTDLDHGNNTSTGVAFSQTDTCASAGSGGAGGTLSAVINAYFPPSAANVTVAAGSTSVTLGASTGAATPIAIGDLLLFIQMQDAAINSTNTSSYGDGATGTGSTNLNNSGVYEFVKATSAVPTTGGTLNFAASGPGGGLLYTYTNAALTATQGQRRFQVIRVPQYSSATLGYIATTPAATAWNGATGGVFVLDVSGILTLGGATLSVDGVGFRGAAGMQLNGDAAYANTDWRQAAPAAYAGTVVAGAHAPKGEGIAGTPLWVESNATFLLTNSGYPSGTAGSDGTMARGAPGNAGGGGTDAHPSANDQNSGGGGGGNGGFGGQGGNAWNSNLSTGGLGGTPFPANADRVVMGGGGGAGTRNNSPGLNQASSGSAGGGIVIIRTGNLTGMATISANGAAPYNGTANDAGGGGGAGGSVIVLSASGGESGLTISAHGGRGGDAWDTRAFAIADRHGPGGGGGGGAVFVSGPGAGTVDVTAGANGVTLNPGVPYGATPGGAGVYVSGVPLPSGPGSQSGAECTPDMTIAKSHVGNFTQGGTGTYTITVTNASIGSTATSSGTVTVVDTLPAGLTATAISGTGWTCVLATLTCTRSTALAPGASYPSITLTVSVAGNAPATVTNTATVSGGGEVNTANDTATDPTNVLPAVDADMSLTKTASVTEIMQGNNFTYTLGVTNNGPANATGVSVTDTLPSQVTYVSAVPSQGSCSQSAGVVTCPLGAMANGTSASITITVRAVTPSLAVNTATVTATQTDPVLGNNTATADVTITFSPSRVELETFSAAASGNGVFLSWKTGAETRNLGFNVYREENGARVRLNPGLIAGSALVFRHALPQHAAKTYAWIDHSPGAGNSVYWLEDVDLDGSRTFHGPAVLQGGMTTASVPQAMMIQELDNGGVDQEAETAPSHIAEATAAVSRFSSDQRQTQFQLAAHPAVKIFVSHEGWYRITQPQLVAAGLNPSVDPVLLRLFAEGIEQPIRITGATSGEGGFGPQAAIEFYGTGIDTPYSDKRVYWLAAGNRPGKRIQQEPAKGEGGTSPRSFLETVELKQRTTYMAQLLKENTDNFFGALVSSTPVDQLLRTPGVASPSVAEASLQVVLQGVTDGVPHDVTVTMNGAVVGDVIFTGQDEGNVTLQIPRGVLRQSANSVTLTAQGGQNDLSLVDYIRLAYFRTYVAQSDFLKFTAEAGDYVVVTGFRQPPTRLVDITNPVEPLELVPEIGTEKGTYLLKATIPWKVAGTHTLLALSDQHLAKPFSVTRNHPSNWHSAQPGGEVVIISHPHFAGSLDPLVQLRRKQGKSVALVQVDQIYDEFNFGERSPYAVQELLKTATAVWRNKPRYLLLVGHASVDPRNYLGFGFFDFVPTKIIITSELKTASDDWFSDFGNTGFAQIPTGRFPARTLDDAKTAVARTVTYEKSLPASWNNRALLVADRDDPTFSFTQGTQSVQALLPQFLNVTGIFAGALDPSTARQQVLEQMNSGQLLVNYLGHGSVEVWSGEDLLDDTTAASLSNGSHTPVVLIMNCLNGFFHDVYTESLAEALLLSKNGGAVAVWASSGLTSPLPQLEMDQILVQTVSDQPSLTLGDAILQTKSGITDPDVRRTFLLFGDPLLRLKWQPSTAQRTVARPPAKAPGIDSAEDAPRR